MGRLVRVVPAIVLVISAMLANGPAQAAQCETDVSIAMAASQSPQQAQDHQVEYRIDLLNVGPCRPSGITVVDDLSLLTGFTRYEITASTPTSWSCTLGPTSFTCTLPGAKLGIAEDRYAALTLLVTWPSAPASTTNKATVSTPYPDPNLIDNTAYSATVDPTSSLVTEPLTAGASQQQKISSPGQSLSAQVRFGGDCSTVFTSCFGDLVRIDVPNADPNGYFVLSFLYTADVTPPGSTLNQLGILHLFDGVERSLESCPSRGPIPVWGCIAQKDRLSNVAYKTPANPKGYYYIFTVYTPNNGDWGGDN